MEAVDCLAFASAVRRRGSSPPRISDASDHEWQSSPLAGHRVRQWGVPCQRQTSAGVRDGSVLFLQMALVLGLWRTITALWSTALCAERTRDAIHSIGRGIELSTVQSVEKPRKKKKSLGRDPRGFDIRPSDKGAAKRQPSSPTPRGSLWLFWYKFFPATLPRQSWRSHRACCGSFSGRMFP